MPRRYVRAPASTDVAPDSSRRSTATAWRRTTLVLAGFAFWTLLGVFFASQIVILGAPEISWRQALQMAMPRWYVWGALTPGIVAVDRWLGADRSLAARLALHLALGVAWTCVALTIRLLIRPLNGLPWPESIAAYALSRFYWDILIYAVIAGVAVAREYAAKARDEERRSHRLQIESIELQRHLTEARLQSLRSQLHPHFLFNALNTISALTESDPKTARRLMDQLGQLLRSSLDHASRPLVTLAEELTFLDDYLAIESVRFEDRITTSVDADDDVLAARVPSFLLQPIVENAIRHGVGPRVAGGHIAVTATRAGAFLRLRVRDNGLGLSSDWRQRRDAGVGLRNIAARLEQLYPQRHEFRVTAGGSGGVDVEIDLPWQEQAENPELR